MLNFLRKLRLNSLKGKYLKYAIGEIFLVVAGILIALSINNLNENLKNRKIHKRLIENLRVEFEANRNQINTVQLNQNKSIRGGFQLIESMNDFNRTNLDSLKKWIAWQGNLWTFDAQTGVLNNAISSGEIHLIDSDSLKNILFGWQSLATDLKEEQQRLFSDFNRILPVLEKYVQLTETMDYYKDKFKPSEFSSDYRGLLSDPQFEDVIANHLTLLLDQMEELDAIKAQNKLILQLLRLE